MKHRRRRVLDEIGVEQRSGVAHDLHRDHLRRIGNVLARGGVKNQTILGQQDHGSLLSSFLTSCTKSVASWNRRYTLANRTYATSSIPRKPSITRSPMTDPG